MAVLFVLLALSAGFLMGWALTGIGAPSQRRRRRAWGLLALGGLTGAASVLVYFAGPGGGPASPVAKTSAPWEKFQFELNEIEVPRANSAEKVRAGVSLPLALSYLNQGAEVWNKKYKCIGCHVNGSFMLVQPALSAGAARALPSETRRFYLETLKPFIGKREEIILKTSNRPSQVVWAAAGLASWDAHVTGSLSPETDEVLRCMFRLQKANGTWAIAPCWPPLQSDSFQLAAVGAMAAGTAPGWLHSIKEPEVKDRIKLLRKYLRETVPPHEYAGLWRLWASTKFPGLMDPGPRGASQDTIWKLQHEDGGWALRDFAGPGQWADVRREQLEAEPDYRDAPSDGHMTGLAVCVLRDIGIPASDPRIQRAVKWLLGNQRTTGRWWAKSLNSDTYNFLTYSATCFALAALEKCDRLPR